MRSLGAVHAASADVSIGIPAELVHEYVDKGLSPDAYTAEMGLRAAASCDAVERKQRAMRGLADEVREVVRTEAAQLLPET